MRNSIIIFFLIHLCLQINAQAPNKFSFQAVVRNNADQLIKNQPVGVRMNIVQGSESENVVYQEIFNPNPTTNGNGLMTLLIGSGIAIQGSFSNIDWASGPYFIRTEVDPSSGTNYTLVSTSQLLSIPYALLAKNVENIPAIKLDQLNDVNSLAAQAGQVLKWNGTEWTAANDNAGGGSGPSYTPGPGISIDVNNVITNTGDLSATNEIQQLELTGNQLKLSGANTVTLPTGTTYTAGTGISLANNTITNTGDNDNNATNEIQQISLSGTVLTLSPNGGSVTLPSSGGGGGDNWGTQSVVNDNATISGNGTPANPMKLANQNATNGQVLKSNGNTWLPGADNDNQNLSIAGNQLSISNGNSVSIPPDGDGSATNEIQTLSISGQNLSLSNNGGTVTLPSPVGDNWGSQSVTVNSTLTGNGTAAIPLGVANNSINSNHIINGSIEPLDISTNGTTGANDPLVLKKLPGGSWNFDPETKYVGGNGIAIIPINSTPGSNKVVSITTTGAVENNVLTYKNGEWKPFANNNPWIVSGNDIYNSNSETVTIGGLPIAAPEFKLDLQGALRLAHGNGQAFGLEVESSGAMAIRANALSSSNTLIINDGGQVMIGTDAPSSGYLFKVAGKALISAGASFGDNVLPLLSNTTDLGSSTAKWDKLYVAQIEGSTSINGNFIPASVLNLLGNSSFKWAAVWSSTGTIQTSDRNLKKDIRNLSYGLKEVMAMKPVGWNWKDSRMPERNIGFIAQDIESIIPEAVVKPTQKDFAEYEAMKALGKEGEVPSYGMKYTELIPVLTKAIQEQQAMIEALKKEVENLKKLINK